MKKGQIIGLAAATFLLLPMYGCTPAAKNEAGYVGNVNNPSMTGDVRSNNPNRNTSAIVFRPDLADHLRTQIPGVRMASVFVRGNNAYVAINNGVITYANPNRIVPGGGAGGAAGNYPPNGVTGNYAGGPTVPGNVPGGTITGRIPSPNYNGVTPGGSIGGYTGGAIGGNPGGTTIGGGPYGAPITGGMNGGGGNPAARPVITPELRQRVVSEIRRTDPAITNVYVSNDPALLSHFRGYSTGSLRSTSEDFNAIIRQFFPNVR
ncbi:hypothetical protein LSG31_20405 [Fodinisporobacter ferrooxydans]|uniref:Sporulation protein n=1 Tax=Fodinisporobacter ferrooxydans TaxID=2901836 RepID=A0ABY4CQT0_9BACL|nr:hypothetical protein LSG31_20405 [Alicyclobacillaceae bacterium MYW30-H2]